MSDLNAGFVEVRFCIRSIWIMDASNQLFSARLFTFVKRAKNYLKVSHSLTIIFDIQVSIDN